MHLNIKITKTFIGFLLVTGLLAFSINNHVSAAKSETSAKQRYKPEDFSHWLDAAYIADATYKTSIEVEAVLAAQGYELTQYKQLKGYSVAYLIATNDVTRQHIIAVRGTSNIENVIVDAAFVLIPDNLTGIDIHQGFLLSARDIYQQVLPVLKPEYRVTTIGHSLGGAAAIIVAMMLDAGGYSVDEVITFGQPKVTNISGSRKFKHLNVIRLVTPKDVVPLTPPLDPMNTADSSDPGGAVNPSSVSPSQSSSTALQLSVPGALGSALQLVGPAGSSVSQTWMPADAQAPSPARQTSPRSAQAAPSSVSPSQSSSKPLHTSVVGTQASAWPSCPTPLS